MIIFHFNRVNDLEELHWIRAAIFVSNKSRPKLILKNVVINLVYSALPVSSIPGVMDSSRAVIRTAYIMHRRDINTRESTNWSCSPVMRLSSFS